MPCVVVFHVGNTLALDSVSDDDGWDTLGLSRETEGILQRFKIIAVTFDGGSAESLCLFQ